MRGAGDRGWIHHTERPPVAEGRRGGPLIVTEDVELLDDLLRLCAAAGAEPEVAPRGAGAAGAAGRRAPLVLVGDDAARRAAAGPPAGAGVLLVGRDQDDPGLAAGGGDRRRLRAAAARRRELARRPHRRRGEGVGRPALTVGVIGGRGGAGASTLACALAVTAARDGRRTMLVDGDPLGGGLDVLLGGEQAGGLRWPDFAASRGPGRRRRAGGVAARAARPAGAQLGPRRLGG